MVRPLARPPRVGDVIADKYRLTRMLGHGGMGRIFAAEHLVLDVTVALKFMHPHLTRDPVSVGRFAHEARAAATLKSPHAARIIDVDDLPTGELYIVMEYLEGTSLEVMARDGRGISVAAAVTYIVQACHALAEAHDRGIIHRDVKPANLLLTTGKSGEPMIKVLDFGLAKSTEADATVSGMDQALGTPQYMSPEQIGGARDLDSRSDVWSLGVTLYELFAGRAAFDASGAMAIFARILRGCPAPLRTLRPDVSPALAAVVDRCLSRDRAARFSSVRDLAQALEMAAPWSNASAPAYVATLVSPSHPWQPATVARASEPRVTWSATPIPVLSIPPAPMSVRPTSISVAATAMSVALPQAAPATRVRGPSLRQTILAALAGPALIAIAATVMALVAGATPRAPQAAASTTSRTTASAPQGSSADVVFAKASSTSPRGKAAAPVGKRKSVASMAPRR